MWPQTLNILEEFFAGNFHKSLGNNFRSSFFGRPSNLALVQPNRDFSGYREGIKREASCFFFPKKTFSNEQVFRGGRDAKCEGVTTKNYKKCRQSVAGVSILRYFSRTLLIIYSHFYRTQVSLKSGLWVSVSVTPRPLVETLLM